MRTADFDYELPSGRIAQSPLTPRDAARLMVLDRKGLTPPRHHRFHDLPLLLRPGDLLVVNNSRVTAARLAARKRPGGGRAELLCLREHPAGGWICLVGGRGLRAGVELQLPDGGLARIEEDLGGPRRRVVFQGDVPALLDRHGQTPLPPYIREPLADPQRYQTVYAREKGSAAAPTAGLHFTPELLARLAAAGVGLAEASLHIGSDTFLPVEAERAEDHPIHREWCELGLETARAVRRARAAGGRAIAVGTTSVRTLETAARAAQARGQPPPQPFQGDTDLYILPGHEFLAVDGLITNFHLPRTTLLMLVSAFAGCERMLEAYRIAVAEGYRFYSFGDAMLVL